MTAIRKAAAVIAGAVPALAFTSAAHAASTTQAFGDRHAVTPAHPTADKWAAPNIPANGHPSIYTWQNPASSLYLEDYRNGTKDGSLVDAFTWNSGNNQHWYAISLGVKYSNIPEFVYENVNSQKCMEDHGYESSGQIDQWSCGNYGNNMRFIYNGYAPTNVSETLRNLANDKYVCEEGVVPPAFTEWSSQPTNLCQWQ
jgi:hypothetical protein